MSFPTLPPTPDHRLGCETDFENLPKGYYWNRFFIGSMMATGLGLWAAIASSVRFNMQNSRS